MQAQQITQSKGGNRKHQPRKTKQVPVQLGRWQGQRVVLSYLLPVFSLIPRAALLLPAQPLPIVWLKPHLFQQPERKSASHALTHNRSFDTGTLTPCCSSSWHYHSQVSTQLKTCPPQQCPQRERRFSLATPAHSSRFSSESPSVLVSAEILAFVLQWLRCRWFCRFCRMRGEAGNSFWTARFAAAHMQNSWRQ